MSIIAKLSSHKTHFVNTRQAISVHAVLYQIQDILYKLHL